ncbi:MAG: tricarballylate utilization 4Fe-4S protein TcuB [SAR324 cluster bacterium]|nr:tricarballylate utilization 4Fe-4S protein TcuB [SAR324 cluster bacterium]
MSLETLKEAKRIMEICNSCRYCEGFCAVYPAMELRRTFRDDDLKFLANLCHNCRDCYYACQYAPPHEFKINVPQTFAELRLNTYQQAAAPKIFKGMFNNNGKMVFIVHILSILIVWAATLLFQNSEQIFGTHLGPNAFFQVISYSMMVVPISILSVLLMAGMLMSFNNFWQMIGGKRQELMDFGSHRQAIKDALSLKYLSGGGHGCNYPDEHFSKIRRNFHHATFYGFMLCFASTISAALYHHFLHLPSPYPIFSFPVLSGSIGGLALLIGTSGLLYLKTRMDPEPASENTAGMDFGFLISLFLTSLTGLLLLILRETPLMGSLLVIHIGVVVGLFITMPYGKFVHGIYRYAALVRNANEQAKEAS